MFQKHPSGVTLIECLIAFVFLMSGVGTALCAAKRFGWLGGLLGFFVGSFGCWGVLLFAAGLAVIVFGIFNGLPEFPVCGNGRCKFRIFMGTDDYHYEKINDDIGVRSKGPQGRLAAAVALLGVVAMWGVRDYEHRRAVNALEARVYDGDDPIRTSAYPNWLNPFVWDGVVETRNFYATMLVHSSIPEVDPQGRMRIRQKPEETPVTLAAKRSYLGRIYLDWAQYPITETEQVETPEFHYLVRFRDLRYYNPDQDRGSLLGAAVELDRNLNVVGEHFGSRRR